MSITYGYSRDHRPDLKQFMMELICTGDGDVPLWMKIGDGNESDQKQFAQSMKEFEKQFNLESLMVADSALYTQDNLKLLRNMKWLSRVPMKIKAAQNLAQSEDSAQFTLSQTEGYSYREVGKTYAGIKQRWLIVESEERRKSDRKQLEKKIEKEFREAEKVLVELTCQRFSCIPDAKRAAEKLLKKSKYHELTSIKVSEVSDKSSGNVSYKVEGKITASAVKIQPYLKQAGRFILATNVADQSQLTAEEMLSKYKGQQSVERGFRFLKDPYFLTDSVFLKSPHRIEALGLIMGLCLLVYTLGQRQLRQSLTRTQSTVKNQLGRPTNRPTLRWVFQCFQSIHWFFQSGEVQVSNLTEERLHLLKFFPASSQRYYLPDEMV
ncbi:IS1634 family transposase [Roseofilum casamattae]|uniref:IS1634 family transposase n=1 Tax=Roseofilum casamattae BLCC-M143 TaxID=3022442 RepID=A0ABT7C4R5_9CYAN|nr:IS1634 family transposase [Roseofilum casamattae]MDJ1185916.1 IS1634 family transposase [Roseofilum casamattae BLCC-M143]